MKSLKKKPPNKKGYGLTGKLGMYHERTKDKGAHEFLTPDGLMRFERVHKTYHCFFPLKDGKKFAGVMPARRLSPSNRNMYKLFMYYLRDGNESLVILDEK